MKIPKIIHQIWSGINEPLPTYLQELGNTWKNDYPDWKYEFWDDTRMNDFVCQYYPNYWDLYNEFQFDVQRWDAIRYLILDKIGGMYVDFDYESLQPLDELLENKICCFAMDPQSHCNIFNRKIMFNNALMANVPNSAFMKKVVSKVFSPETVRYTDKLKNLCVFKTTGPWALIDLYEQCTEDEKKEIYLIPDKYVTPFDVMQARRFINGEMSDELEECLEEAYAIHFFFNSWLIDK